MTAIADARLPAARSRERLARRHLAPVLRPWGLAVLVVPAVLAAAFALSVGGDVEAELTASAEAVLAAEGVPGVEVTFDGRDGRLEVPDGVSVPMSRRTVAAIDGVRTVSVVPDRIGEPIRKPRAAEPLPAARSTMDRLVTGALWWVGLAFLLGAGVTGSLLVRRIPAE